MKILVVSDKVDELVYSPRVRDRFSEVDLVISCGDLPYSYLEFLADALHRPVFFVRGNHADRNRLVSGDKKGPLGGFDLHRQVVAEQGVLIAGLEGSLRYRPGSHQYSQFEMWLLVLRMTPQLIYYRMKYGRYLDIFVSHSPPFGVQDCSDLPHQGFKAFRWFLRTFKPRFHFHGHIHLYSMNEPRETVFEDTRVINSYRFIEVETEF
jgi:Icc-related predicted phosphoesterase